MKKSILFGIFIICISMLLIPLSSAIEIQQLTKIDEKKSIDSNDNSVKLNIDREIANVKKSSYVNIPPDGNKEYYAIIAGCTEYEDSSHNLPSIGKPFPESTMRYVYDILITASNWKEENIKLLLNNKATKQNIIDSFNDMANIVDGDDIFLFSWTGHGTQVIDIDGDDGDGYDEGICPYDTKIKGKELINVITDDELDSYLSLIGAEGLFLMFESCMSGGLVDVETEPNYSFVDVNDDRRVVVMSTPPDKLGFAIPEIGWPMLFLYSMAFSDDSCDIDNDGWISAEEAFMYVDNAYPSFENEFILNIINITIPIALIANYFYINTILRILGVKRPIVRCALSLLWTMMAYKIYQKDYTKQLLMEYIRLEWELMGIENNPNISDNYFGELNIIKIE